MDLPYPFSQEGSRRFDSPLDTPTLSEISICKEQPNTPTPPLSEISICKEQHGVEPQYTVEKYAEKDDAGYVPTWKTRLHRLLPLTSAIAIGAYWLYFAFRVRYTVAAQNLGHTVYPVAWLFLSIEFGVACETPDGPRILLRGCLLMHLSHSTGGAYSIVAMSLVHASPPP